MSYRDIIVDPMQMRSVADSLRPTGSYLEDDITYEINGSTLTWIARYTNRELKIECRNMSEIIDGYYKAEFFIDTKKMSELSNYLESPARDVTFTSYYELREPDEPRSPMQPPPQQPIIETLRNLRGGSHRTPNSKTRAKDNIANGYALRERKPFVLPEKGGTLENTHTHGPSRKKPPTASPISHADAEEYQGTPKTPIPPHNSPAKNDSEFPHRRNGISGPDTALLASDANPVTVGAGRGRRRGRCGRRKSDPLSNSLPKANLGNVRRGKRIRKLSIFHDCYIPVSNNEWISEAFIGTNKMAL